MKRGELPDDLREALKRQDYGGFADAVLRRPKLDWKPLDDHLVKGITLAVGESSMERTRFLRQARAFCETQARLRTEIAASLNGSSHRKGLADDDLLEPFAYAFGRASQGQREKAFLDACSHAAEDCMQYALDNGVGIDTIDGEGRTA